MRKELAAFLTVAGFVALVLAAVPVAGEDPQAAAAVPTDIPDAARATVNPREASAQSIDNGRQIFTSQCTMCHGTNGNGKGDLATRFGYKIPDFSVVEVQQSRTDGELFYILTNGHGKMSGEGKRLSADTRWDLINFIRSLGPVAEGN